MLQIYFIASTDFYPFLYWVELLLENNSLIPMNFRAIFLY